MPANDAAPPDVVRAYAAAVHTGDCTTAAALVSVPAQSWCRSSIDIISLAVTQTTTEPKATTAGPGPMIERVWVDLRTKGNDGSLPAGDHLWSYLLDRTGPNGAWRIYDQGMG